MVSPFAAGERTPDHRAIRRAIGPGRNPGIEHDRRGLGKFAAIGDGGGRQGEVVGIIPRVARIAGAIDPDFAGGSGEGRVGGAAGRLLVLGRGGFAKTPLIGDLGRGVIHLHHHAPPAAFTVIGHGVPGPALGGDKRTPDLRVVGIMVRPGRRLRVEGDGTIPNRHADVELDGVVAGAIRGREGH